MLNSAWKTIGFALEIIQVWEKDILQCSLAGGNEKE